MTLRHFDSYYNDKPMDAFDFKEWQKRKGLNNVNMAGWLGVTVDTLEDYRRDRASIPIAYTRILEAEQEVDRLLKKV